MLVDYIIENLKLKYWKSTLKKFILYILINYKHQFIGSLYEMGNKSQNLNLYLVLVS